MTHGATHGATQGATQAATQGAQYSILGDGKRLADILALAGPETATLILRQMQADLGAVATALAASLDRPAQAAGPQDWSTIRAQTHVLISLAGTIGADRLHAAAIDLNAAAHDRDVARTALLVGPLMSDLAHLCEVIAARLASDIAPPDLPALAARR